MKFEVEYYGDKGVVLHIIFTGLTPKQIVEALMAPYDEAIMDELITNSRVFPLKERKEYERKSFIGKRIYRGRLVVRGGYKLYLDNREGFMNNPDQNKKESEERK